jgi:LysM domain
VTRLAATVAVVVALVVAGVGLASSSPPSRAAIARPGPERPTFRVPVTPELTDVQPPPVVPVTPPSAPAPPTSYQVQAGDTLAAIAAAHGLDWPGLCQANMLADCGRIYPGQVLALRSVPVQSADPARQKLPTPSSGPSGDGCAVGAAYVASHAAPGFGYECSPGVAEHACGGSHDVGCTHWERNAAGVTTGTIYVDSTCAIPIVWETESSNSRVDAGVSHAPLDPFGPAHCPAGWTPIAP